MKIKILILHNGQQLIAEVNDHFANLWGSGLLADRAVDLCRPCVFTVEDPPSVNEQKAFNVSLYPWCPLLKGITVRVTESSIISVVDPVEGLEKMYRETVMKEETPDGE